MQVSAARFYSFDKAHRPLNQILRACNANGAWPLGSVCRMLNQPRSRRRATAAVNLVKLRNTGILVINLARDLPAQITEVSLGPADQTIVSLIIPLSARPLATSSLL